MITFHLCFNLIKEVRLIINNSPQGHYNADLAFEPRSIRRQGSFSQPEAYTASHERTSYALFFSSVKTYLPRVPNHSLVSTVLTSTSDHDSNCHLTSPSPWSQVLGHREHRSLREGRQRKWDNQTSCLGAFMVYSTQWGSQWKQSTLTELRRKRVEIGEVYLAGSCWAEYRRRWSLLRESSQTLHRCSLESIAKYYAACT